MGFLDNYGNNNTSAFGTYQMPNWLDTQPKQQWEGFDRRSPLNTYGTQSNMSALSSTPKPEDTGLTLSKLGEYGDVASQWAQPVALGMNAYSTFFGQGKESHDKNMTLLNQQIADNKDKLQRRSALNDAWARTESGR